MFSQSCIKLGLTDDDCRIASFDKMARSALPDGGAWNVRKEAIVHWTSFSLLSASYMYLNCYRQRIECYGWTFKRPYDLLSPKSTICKISKILPSLSIVWNSLMIHITTSYFQIRSIGHSLIRVVLSCIYTHNSAA